MKHYDHWMTLVLRTLESIIALQFFYSYQFIGVFFAEAFASMNMKDAMKDIRRHEDMKTLLRPVPTPDMFHFMLTTETSELQVSFKLTATLFNFV